ncbi:MAG: potassium/proton antiporter [Bacteroidaceae bacterium]|nr:potassium/proton antiporter [Bacteroidaceae bacterium]
MEYLSGNFLLLGSVLIFVSVLISKTSYKFGLPTLLLFLLVGMFFGTEGLGVSFDDSQDAQFIGMMALSIILFTGGMDTKVKDIKPVLSQGIVLSTVGVLLTTVITGSFIYFICRTFAGIGHDLALLTSLLMAATMSSTDSASVFNLLRSQKMDLKYNLRPLLELESGSNDPMAYMLTIVLIDVIATNSGQMEWSQILIRFFLQFLIGSIVGYLFGKVAIRLVNNLNLSNSSLYPIMLLSLVWMNFILADMQKGNGYLSVYIMGLMLGNNRLSYKKEISSFMNVLTWVFQIVMFLCLGLLVRPSQMIHVFWFALLIGVFMIFVARPASVFLCLLPFKGLTNKAKLFCSWVGLRGASPIIFATYPVVAGVEGSDLIFNVVFVITMLSLLAQGMTITPVARYLNLDLPLKEDKNDFGVELPEEFEKQLYELNVNQSLLDKGNTLAKIGLPKGTLVMMIKRGDQILVPNGALELQEGDKLLMMSEKNQDISMKDIPK